MTPQVLPFFHLFDTYGIPLNTIFELFQTGGVLPDWQDFWLQAEVKGWNPYTTYGKLREAVGEVYDDAFLAGWELRMKHCISIRWGRFSDHPSEVRSSAP